MSTNRLFGNEFLVQSEDTANYLRFNDFLKRYGGLISVINDTTSSPPGSPTLDDAYIVGPAASGAWSGLSGRVVIWYAGSWKVLPNLKGLTTYNVALLSPGECYTSSPYVWFYPQASKIQTISTATEVLLDTGRYGNFYFSIGNGETLTLDVVSPLPGRAYTCTFQNTSGTNTCVVSLKAGAWLRQTASYTINPTKYTTLTFTSEPGGTRGVAVSVWQNMGIV
jgi:hypothetical protein